MDVVTVTLKYLEAYHSLLWRKRSDKRMTTENLRLVDQEIDEVRQLLEHYRRKQI